MDKEIGNWNSDKSKDGPAPRIILMPQEAMDKLDPLNSTLSDAMEGLKTGEQEGEEELDIPGSELDDVTEEIGSEDEENNYYSIGGDQHENLEEDKG
jgi:hypothetical protein